MLRVKFKFLGRFYECHCEICEKHGEIYEYQGEIFEKSAKFKR